MKNSKIGTVLLVTADRKEDWWWREQGKTVGPHPELIREILREGGVELFWMYSSDQFVEHANKYSTASVSTQSVAEIKHVAQSASENSREFHGFANARRQFHTPSGIGPTYYLDEPRVDKRLIEESVGTWLSRRSDFVEPNHPDYPDFLVRTEDGLHGYEVKYVRRIRQSLSSSAFTKWLLRGYLEINEGRLCGFTLVIVIAEDDFYEIVESDLAPLLRQTLKRQLAKYPIDSIIIGVVVDEEFGVVVEQMGPDRSNDSLILPVDF